MRGADRFGNLPVVSSSSVRIVKPEGMLLRRLPGFFSTVTLLPLVITRQGAVAPLAIKVLALTE
jgi:hypothetical protein